LWTAEERYLGVVLNSPGGKEWWQENYRSISTGFGGAIEQIMHRYKTSEADQTDALASRWGSSL
jgi:hypothetical protein